MASSPISAEIEVTGEKTFESALAAINNQIKSFQAGADAASTSLDKMGFSEDSAQKKGQALQSVIDANREKLNLLQEKYQSAQQHLAKLADEMEKAKQAGDPAAIDKATNAYNKQSSVVSRLEADMARTERAITSAQGEMEDLSDEVEKNTSLSSKLSSVLQNELVNSALDKLSSALSTIEQKAKEFASAFMDFVKDASQYETAFAKVKTLADENAVSYDVLSQSIMDLSERTGIAATEIAEATYQAISGGVNTAEAVNTVATATQLAAGGFTTSTAAIDILTTAMNAYGISATESSKIADMLITTQNLGKTSVDELSKSMGQVLPVASAYNVGLEDVSAAYAVLTAGGINTANSTTYLRSMLQELAKEGSNVSNTLKDKTHKSFAQLMEGGASLDDVLQILMGSVKGNTTAFANLWSSQTAGLGALALVNAGSEKYNDTLKAMQESAGSTSDAYNTMSDTFEHRTQLLQNSFTNLKTSLYEQIKEPIGQVMTVASDAMEKIKSWAASAQGQAMIQKLAEAISNMAEKLSGLLEPALNIVIDLVEKAADVFGFLAEHADLVITGFVALKAAMAVLNFLPIINSVSTLIQTFSAASLGMTGLVGVVVAGIALLITHFDKVKEVATAVASWIGEKFAAAWETVQNAWNACGEFFQGVASGIMGALGSIGGWIGEQFESAYNAVTSVWDAVTGFFSGVFDNIVGAFADLPGSMLDVGKNAVTGIWEGIKGAKDWLFGKLTGWVSDTVGWIKDKLGIHSPSTVMRDEVGRMLSLGVAEGITGSLDAVQKAYQSLMPSPSLFTAAADSITAGVRAQGGVQSVQAILADNRPIILQLNDRELGRAVRGYA